MAKRRHRLETVTEAEKAEIQNLIGSFSPYQEELLNALESGDDKDIDALLNSVQGRFGAQTESIKNRIKALSQKLPAKKDALQRFITEQITEKDESALADEELKDRQEAYRGLNDPGGARTSQFAKLKNEIAQRFKSEYGGQGPTAYGSKFDSAVESAANQAAREMLDSKSFNIQQFVNWIGTGLSSGSREHLDKVKGIAGGINNEYLPRVQKGEYADIVSPAINQAENIKRIQDILDSRMTESQKQAALEQFLAETPEALKRDRKEYLTSQEDLAGDYLRERGIPSILNELNKRGTIESPGEFSSALASEAGGLQGRIEETARTLEEQDNIFFADASYRLTLSKLEASEQDYRSQVAAERTRVRQAQGKNFASREGQLARDFESDILRWEQDRALNLRRSELNLKPCPAPILKCPIQNP